MEMLTQLLNRRRRRRRFHMHQRNFPEAFFRRNLKMRRESFDNLLTLLRGYVQREDTRT